MVQSLIPVAILSILVVPLPIAVYLTVILLRRDTRIGTPIAMIVTAGAVWSSGYAMELLDRIRKLDEKVPVLLVSGYARHEVRQQEAKSPNISFLQKPFTMDQFKKAVEAQLG